MAYIVGLCSEEEIKELERRGWDIEEAPKSLTSPDCRDGLKTVMVWVDSSMFVIMDGPDWDKGLSPIPLYNAVRLVSGKKR